MHIYASPIESMKGPETAAPGNHRELATFQIIILFIVRLGWGEALILGVKSKGHL